MRGFSEVLSNANVLRGFKIQRNNSAFGKVLSRDFKGCARHTSADRINHSSSEVCEASPLKSPTRRSQITHPLTPSAREGEVLDSLGVAQTHLLFASQKVSKKTFGFGDSRESCEISPTANPKSCAGIGDSYKTCEVLPTLIFQSCAGISDSRESFLPTFSKSRWAEAQIKNKTSPSLAEVAGVWVNSQNLKYSRESKTPIIPHKFTTLTLHKPNLRTA